MSVTIRTHNLGAAHGTLIENTDTGTVKYIPAGKILPAFNVRIADVTGASGQKKGWLKVLMKVYGHGITLAEVEVNHGTTEVVAAWFHSRISEGNPRMKKCPKCAEQIQDEAIFCKHCHSDLTPFANSENISPEIPKGSDALAASEKNFEVGSGNTEIRNPWLDKVDVQPDISDGPSKLAIKAPITGQGVGAFLVFLAFFSYFTGFTYANDIAPLDSELLLMVMFATIVLALVASATSYLIIETTLKYSKYLRTMFTAYRSRSRNFKVVVALSIVMLSSVIGFVYSSSLNPERRAAVEAEKQRVSALKEKEQVEKQKAAELRETEIFEKQEAARRKEAELQRLAAMTPAERAAEERIAQEKAESSSSSKSIASEPVDCYVFSKFVEAKGHSWLERSALVADAQKRGDCVWKHD